MVSRLDMQCLHCTYVAASASSWSIVHSYVMWLVLGRLNIYLSIYLTDGLQNVKAIESRGVCRRVRSFCCLWTSLKLARPTSVRMKIIPPTQRVWCSIVIGMHCCCDVMCYRLTTAGRRTFSCAGPSAWNSLPSFLRDETLSLDS